MIHAKKRDDGNISNRCTRLQRQEQHKDDNCVQENQRIKKTIPCHDSRKPHQLPNLYFPIVKMLVFYSYTVHRQTVDARPIITHTIHILQNPSTLFLGATIEYSIDSALGNMGIRNTLTNTHSRQIIHRRTTGKHFSQPQTIAFEATRIARVCQFEQTFFGSSLHFSAVGAPPEGGKGVLLGAGARHVDEAEGDAAFVFGLGDFGGGGAEGCGEGFGGRVGEGDVGALGFF
jgi:hypothetical protein